MGISSLHYDALTRIWIQLRTWIIGDTKLSKIQDMDMNTTVLFIIQNFIFFYESFYVEYYSAAYISKLMYFLLLTFLSDTLYIEK